MSDRTAESLATWLREHPGVDVISRDRVGAYVDGARQGAPDAVQVADRFHLLANVGELLERVLGGRRTALRQAAIAVDHAMTVVALHRQGHSHAAISRQTGLGRRTVRHYLRAGAFPERAAPSARPTMLTPYEPYLRTR